MSLPAFRPLPVLRYVSTLVCLLSAACGGDPPTAVSPNHPALAIRQYSNACTPEVLVSSADSVEITKVTFENVVEGCRPGLVPWGIDMADPVGTDVPQGNGLFTLRSADVANAPSGVFAAVGATGTPPQVFIEFDPPVSSVELDYSIVKNVYSIWGGKLVHSDSIQVSATTKSQSLLDQRVLHSNMTSVSTPYNVWSHTRLQSFSDQITWLGFTGNVAIDNLTIVRRPLTCPSSVQRGQVVRCVITAGSGTVTGWSFRPDSGQVPDVQEVSADTVWAGFAAVPGKVTVTLSRAGATLSYSAHYKVTNRPSVWSSTWSYTTGTFITAPDIEPGPNRPNSVLGMNCPVASCALTRRVQPDPVDSARLGYTSVQIRTGPNQGYWYVQAGHYNMNRVGNLNPGVFATSARTYRLLPLSAVTRDCRRGLGYAPKDTLIVANFYNFNAYCGSGVNIVTFIAGLWGHEGFGYNGGKGHETLAREAAGEPKNDPYTAIEPLVYSDSAALDFEVSRRVVPISDDISTRSADPKPTDNIPVDTPIWYWIPALNNWSQFKTTLPL